MKLKNLIGVVVASTMLVSSLTVANVTTVFAGSSATWANSGVTVSGLATIKDPNSTSDDARSVVIDMGTEAKTTTAEGLSNNAYLDEYKLQLTSLDSGKECVVDGQTFTGYVQTKGLASRAFAISVEGPCQIKVYSITNKSDATREVDITDTFASSPTALASTKSTVAGTGSATSYQVTTYNYTGSDAKTFYFYESSNGGIFTCGLKITYGLKNVAVTGVSISSDVSSVQVGKSKTLTATVEPDDATDASVTWSSSDTSVAKVDANTGVVTGVKVGTATITATTTDGNFTATKDIEVKEAYDLAGTSGDATKLVAPTQTTVFNVYDEVVKTDTASGASAFTKGNLYFDNQFYASGAPLYYDKGIRLKAKQDEFAVKLSPGSTLSMDFIGSGSSTARYGFFAKATNVNSKDDTDNILALTDNISVAGTNGDYTDTLEYTNNETADQVVYVSATADSYFKSFTITVPEPEEEDDGTPILTFSKTDNADDEEDEATTIVATIKHLNSENAINSITVTTNDGSYWDIENIKVETAGGIEIEDVTSVDQIENAEFTMIITGLDADDLSVVLNYGENNEKTYPLSKVR